jgi:hypothetical protein
MLESLLHLLLKTDESLSDATRAAAVANWMALFDGKWPTLQRLVDDYAGLVRVHALQPNTAYKKMAAWEKGLFRKLGDAEAAELRKQKMFFMESLELPEIEEHVAKHWALVEAKKKAGGRGGAQGGAGRRHDGRARPTEAARRRTARTRAGRSGRQAADNGEGHRV